VIKIQGFQSHPLKIDLINCLLVNQNPVVSLGDDQTIFVSDNILLDAGSGFASYNWSTGETSQTIQVDGSLGIGEHTFTVTIIDNNNCTAFDEIIITIEEAVSIISLNKMGSLLKLYPNPSKGILNIEIENMNEEFMLHIISETGQTILSRKYDAFNKNKLEQLDLSAYPPGAYLIKVVSGQNVKVEKFILCP
jgi:hypothetical protein